MVQLRRIPLADQAADVLLARIRAGEWPLGARLPGETTLAPQLGVGRSTVREAIRRLAGRGVLDSRQGSGVYVTALDAPEEWDEVLRRADIVTVLEARTAIEVEATTLAAVRRTPSDLRALRRALGARRTPAQSVEEHVDADMALHRAIVVASHNEVLLELFDGFVPRVRRAMVDMLGIRPVPDEAADQDLHAEVVEAIAERRSDVAARVSRAHLDALKASVSGSA
ncbi:GntR family transcriptional regulator [Cnuibacter physcomitrellae]|uniref:GntR family transcriptional regulator n=1 Tax=Cnuibacter physcomitrellae TaxID=1619308 RepID=A0A1X9LIH8_9MICO|nr:FadR/GntR family transcriptional regulator [Cnuibacter physcomitrellae]ARJ04996.1 GntR family transcriptional regulator [Cnuibacter physcomitrellae]GGI34699.1 GntR family transcriptional regulator [Cnuibacter physcomitrellae]